MKKKCPKCGQEWEGYRDESATNHFCENKDYAEVRRIISKCCAEAWDVGIKGFNPSQQLPIIIVEAHKKIVEIINRIDNAERL
jgi:hypothetical protein